MHVLAERIDTVGNGFGQRLSGADAFLQDVTHSGVKQGLPVREVPVQGPDTDTGAPCYGVSCRLAANFENEFNRRFDKSLPVLQCISPHSSTLLSAGLS